MEYKICSQCKRELPIEDFYWKQKSKGTRRSECKTCHSNYVKEKYHDRKQVLQDIKSEQQCAKCGESRGYLLDFHHLDPTKKENDIARMTSSNYPLSKIMDEIEKCIVLCANCHREFHFLEERENLTIEKYLNTEDSPSLAEGISLEN